jgi:hypothetical protein
VNAQFRSRYTTTKGETGTAPFFAAERDGVFSFSYKVKSADKPLKMPIYFVGSRFSEAELRPVDADFSADKVQYRDQDYKEVALRAVRVGVSEKSGATFRKLDDREIERRIIEDPQRIVSYATLICAGRCEDHWPVGVARVAGEAPASAPEPAAPAKDAPSELPPGIEIELIESNRPITDKARLETLVAKHPFTRCLTNYGIGLDIEASAPGSRVHFLVADRYETACDNLGVTHKSEERLAQVDLALYPVGAEGSEGTSRDGQPLSLVVELRDPAGVLLADPSGTIGIVDESNVDVISSVTVSHAQLDISLPDELPHQSTLTLKGRLESYKPVDLPLTLPSVGPLLVTFEPATAPNPLVAEPPSQTLVLELRDAENEPIVGKTGTVHVQVKGTEEKTDIEVDEENSSSVMVPFIALPIDKEVTIAVELDGFEPKAEKVTRSTTDTTMTLQLKLTKSRTIAELRLPLTFPLLGDKQFSADALMLSRDCRYSIELTPPGEGAKAQRIALTAETRSEADTRRWLIPTGKGSDAKLPPGSTARLVVEPITEAKAGECPQPLDDTPIPLDSPDADGALALPIRHPRPWLLVVATSADFPNDERLKQRQQAERRDSFWFDLLTAVANERKASNPNGFDWLFAQVVEGSAAGKAEQVLAGSQTAPEVARDKPDGVLDMSEAQATALVSTPKTAGAVGALPVRQLEAAVLNFAGGNYPTLPGRYHTVLWVQGDGTFAAARACTQFGALAESFAKKQVRLLAYRPARKVSDTGWTEATEPPAPAPPAHAAPAAPAAERADAVTSEADATATPAAEGPPPAPEPKHLAQALEPYSDKAGFDGVSVCNRAQFGGGAGSELIVFIEDGASRVAASEQKPLKALADALRRFREDPPAPDSGKGGPTN